MDYAFAPGTSNYDVLARDLFTRRPGTELKTTRQGTPPSSRRSISRVDEYVQCLSSDSDVTRPAGIIWLGTHGNDRGNMWITYANIDLDSNGSPDNPTTYEVLVAADIGNFCDIPATLRNDDTKIRIRGCNIGQDFALPFLQKVKSAFGGNVPVSAPKHFHNIAYITGTGYYEYFCYEFTVYKKTAHGSRTSLINAFKAGPFTFLPSVAIPIADGWWARWIPRNISLGDRRVDHRTTFNPPLTPKVGDPITVWTQELDKGFRHRLDEYELTVEVDSDPGSSPARETAVFDALRGASLFQQSAQNPFPQQKRYELDTAQDFIDAFNWDIEYKVIDGDKVLVANASRHKYTLQVPITANPDLTDRTKNRLIMNFYPDLDNPINPIEQISETDAEYYQIV